MSFNVNAAEDLRKLTAKILIPFMFLHIPLILVIGYVTGNNVLIPTIAIGIFALIPFLSYRMVKTAPLTRYLTAISFMLIIATLVYGFQGHAYQIDMHMYFFAGLAMLLGFADWRVYIVATAVVAVHHLGLNFIVPSWVFPEASLYRVLMHAVIVIFETAILALATIKLVDALDNASEATMKAHEASNELERATQKQREIEYNAQLQQAEEIDSIASEFEKQICTIVDAVQGASNQLKEVANQTTTGATNVKQNASNASEASTSISNSINSVASSSEELSSSVSEISRQVTHSTEIASEASDQGQKAGQEVQALSKSVNEISNVIDLISDIANQTNLLALNATIEAARAGDAGKGFAVVASEVKNLANQTAKATEQITQQISAIIGATDDTVRGIESISTTLVKVQETSATIASAIEEQGAATREIASNAARTAEDVKQVAQSVEEVQSGAGRNVERSHKVLAASEELNTQADKLRENLEGFVDQLKSNACKTRDIKAVDAAE